MPKKQAEKGVLSYSAGMNNPEDVLTYPTQNILRFKTNNSFFFPDETGRSCMNFVGVDTNTKIIRIPSKNIVDNRSSYYGTLKSTGMLLYHYWN